MKVLIQESVDKKTRTIKSISPEVLEIELQEDNGLVEVIPMTDPNLLIRVHFDVDIYNVDADPFERIMEDLCHRFQCSKSEWAVGTSHREDKLSYHILSPKYSMTISGLRNITRDLHKVFPEIDTRHLYFGLQDELECGYYRLPNQSKKALNKKAPPIKIEQGRIDNFFVTHTDKLVHWKITS